METQNKLKILALISLVLISTTIITGCMDTAAEKGQTSVLNYDDNNNQDGQTQSTTQADTKTNAISEKDYKGMQSYEVLARDAYDILQADPTVKLIDIRTAEDYAKGHIKNAISIPVTWLSTENLLKNGITPIDYIMIYCGSGENNLVAQKILYSINYLTVNSIKGGFAQWQAEGLEITK